MNIKGDYMSAERAEAIQSIRQHQPRRAFTQRPREIKIAKLAAKNRVERLVDLTNELLQEIEVLAHDQAFSSDAGRLQALLQGGGIDLFQEVKRFEISLINLALKQTHGHQARAAKLLNINPTTLNSKIKLYGIEITNSAPEAQLS
jgi:DNA-binding NtrC family response regulator